MWKPLHALRIYKRHLSPCRHRQRAEQEPTSALPSAAALPRVSNFANLHPMKWSVSYFNERVQREIAEWPVGIYADFLRLIFLMEEHGADLRLPHFRAMGDGLFELRCKGEEGIGRAFYCAMRGRQIVILHGFIKKTQETPVRELNAARRRLKEVKHGK